MRSLPAVLIIVSLIWWTGLSSVGETPIRLGPGSAAGCRPRAPACPSSHSAMTPGGATKGHLVFFVDSCDRNAGLSCPGRQIAMAEC